LRVPNRQQVGIWLFVLMALGNSGCAACQDYHRRLLDDSRGRAAWRRQNAPVRAGDFAGDCRRGFLAGYSDVAGGGRGLPPLLPPAVYTSARYRNQEGHEAAEAWFRGFCLGAEMAVQDGVSQYHYPPLGPPVVPAAFQASQMTVESIEPGVELPSPSSGSGLPHRQSTIPSAFDHGLASAGNGEVPAGVTLPPAVETARMEERWRIR